ncbi:alpha/beta hydrolase [Alishewanella longhuensis]|uniref:Alpha/beta hydrolase n=1 Tax=Alishewanella longhuensis TaxID=1091037 RepID=A0ABQ3L0U0_9ALTE|nr:alpha/beta hydrolase [Alishewanella longhuensis]GHG71901.1 alpha/beta hydrolase [Alishewanella longhuensis]
MQLLPWSYSSRYGVTVRGFHSAPSGKPVLHFLHGNGFCGLTYQPMLQQLSTDYDLFLSDTQGHGDSDVGTEFLGWNKAAEIATLAWQAHQPLFGAVATYGLGHSFGGVLTSLMHAEHPTLFQGLVLLDPVLFPPSMLLLARTLEGVRLFKKNPLAKAALKRRQHWPDRATALSYFQSRSLFKNWHPSALNAYVEHALANQANGVSLKCPPQREADVFSSYPKGLWPALRNAKAPIKVIYGEQTFPFVVRAVTKWQQLNSGVLSQLVPGGHCFMQEQPEQSAAWVKQTLNDFNALK